MGTDPEQDAPPPQGHLHTDPRSLTLGQCRHTNHLLCTSLSCGRKPEHQRKSTQGELKILHTQWPLPGIEFFSSSTWQQTKQCFIIQGPAVVLSEKAKDHQKTVSGRKLNLTAEIKDYLEKLWKISVQWKSSPNVFIKLRMSKFFPDYKMTRAEVWFTTAKNNQQRYRTVPRSLLTYFNLVFSLIFTLKVIIMFHNSSQCLCVIIPCNKLHFYALMFKYAL